MVANKTRLVLHVGPHKTASSYIQENLSQNRRVLSEHGWTYPSETTNGQAGHHDLAHNAADYLSPSSERHRTLTELASNVRQNSHNLVLSAEGFCRWNRKTLNTLATILGFEEYEIVYVVRDPLDVFPSFWAEEVKQGHSLAFSDRFAREFADPLGSRLLNPMNDLAPLLAEPRARLHVIPYDVLKTREIDIFEHVMQDILQVPSIKARYTKPVNKKYSIELTEFLRYLTLLYGEGKPYIGSTFRLQFTEKFDARKLAYFARVVRENASNARRVIKVPGDVAFRTRVETVLKNRLAKSWTVEFSEDERLFSEDERRFVYYDSYLLSTSKAVRSAADDVLSELSTETEASLN